MAKLLVADDSLTIQKVIRLALTNEGYEIHSVSDGKDALAQISLFKPDIVLLDVSLPERTAFDIRKELLAQSDLKQIKCILMSSAFEKVDEEQYQALGFDGKLTKPFDPAHLRKVLHEVLETAKKQTKTSIERPPPLPPVDIDSGPVGMAEIDLSSPEGDIRGLTESTLSMAAGAESFDWTMNESAATKAKTPITLSPTNLAISEPDLSMTEPKLPPLPAMEMEDFTPRSTQVHFAQQPFDVPTSSFAATLPFDSGQVTQAFEPARISEGAISNVDSLEIERLVRRQVEETLHRMAKQLLPEIAEKLIKQEIHRILSE